MLRAIGVIRDAREFHRSSYSAETNSRSNAKASPMSTVSMPAYRLVAVIIRGRSRGVVATAVTFVPLVQKLYETASWNLRPASAAMGCPNNGELRTPTVWV